MPTPKPASHAALDSASGDEPVGADEAAGSAGSAGAAPLSPAGPLELLSPTGLTLWLGPTTSGLGWLHTLMSTYLPHFDTLAIDCNVSNSQIPAASVQQACERPVQRLVLSCSSRIDYPCEAVEFLQTQAPHIPFALAVDSWWDGSRRTGLVAPEHLVLPWYRWWDDWLSWLAGQHPQLLSPLVTPADRVNVGTLAGGCASNPRQTVTTAPSGLIIANCHATAAGWSAIATALGHSSCYRRATDFEVENVGKQAMPPRWLLLDDTSFDTHADMAAQVQRYVYMFRRCFPSTLLIAAFSQPTLGLAQAAQGSGCDRILAKPQTGIGLAHALQA